jgi:nitrogen regulatory protein PII
MDRVPKARVEIVIESAGTRDLVRALVGAGAPGYTVLREATGSGRHGSRPGGDVTDLLSNHVVVVLAPRDSVPQLLSALEPVLELFPGIVNVVDVDQVIFEDTQRHAQ